LSKGTETGLGKGKGLGVPFILILNPEVSGFRSSYALQQAFNNFANLFRN